MDLATIYSEEYSYISTSFDNDNISFTSQELLLHIDLAWRAIAKYLWIDYNLDTIISDKASYIPLIEILAIAYYHNAKINQNMVKGEQYITQKSQGSRSVTYRSNVIEIDNNGLIPEVKAALPNRKLQVLG